MHSIFLWKKISASPTDYLGEWNNTKHCTKWYKPWEGNFTGNRNRRHPRGFSKNDSMLSFSENPRGCPLFIQSVDNLTAHTDTHSYTVYITGAIFFLISETFGNITSISAAEEARFLKVCRYDQLCRNSCYDQLCRKSCQDQLCHNSWYNQLRRNSFYDELGRNSHWTRLSWL